MRTNVFEVIFNFSKNKYKFIKKLGKALTVYFGLFAAVQRVAAQPKAEFPNRAPFVEQNRWVENLPKGCAPEAAELLSELRNHPDALNEWNPWQKSDQTSSIQEVELFTSDFFPDFNISMWLRKQLNVSKRVVANPKIAQKL